LIQQRAPAFTELISKPLRGRWSTHQK
jgi:hypothetical protein